MLKFTRKILFILSFFLMTPAFAQVPETQPLVPIIGGSTTTSSTYYGVVYLYRTFSNGTYSYCSGTLIDPYHVLTAAHCVDDIDNVSIRFFTTSATSYSYSRDVTEWVIHPDYTHTTGGVTGDLAIITLASAAPSNITPIPILPPSLAITSADHNSLNLTFVGFGYTSGGATTTGQVKRMVSNILLRNHCDTTSKCVINDPRRYSIDGRTIFFYEENTSGDLAGVCSGDSGGPELIYRNGTMYVAGINSYVDAESGVAACRSYGVGTKVDKYYTYITNYTGTGGTTSEDCTNGVDDDGDGAVDCADADCTSNPACTGGGGDACADAATIQCGDTINGNTLNGSSIYGMSSCSSYGSTDGPEEAYKIAAPAGTVVQIDVALSSSSQDLDLFLMDEVGGTCNTSSCVETSTNWGGNDESLSYTADGGTYYIMVDTDDNPGPYTLTVTCSTGGGGGDTDREVCDNGIDDDGDGAIDCDDSNCLFDDACQSHPENCVNGIDDDLDGAVDCDDADCFTNSACQSAGSEDCTNGVDDDGDGAADCADADCATSSACQATAENCTNGVDDDGDGAADCSDVDCYSDPACQVAPENCTNGVDDDGDGAADCADADCFSDPACSSTNHEICDNGVDDDGDMIVDCNDPDCASFAACAPALENCFNGIDDDGDGAVDCSDSDCYTASQCTTITFSEICDNGMDDDGDGAVDCADADCATHSACTSGSGSSGGCSANPDSSPSLPVTLFVMIFMVFNILRKRKSTD